MVNHRHNPIPDLKIGKFAHHPRQKQDAVSTPLTVHDYLEVWNNAPT
jgi:hypothetical protein